MASPQITDRAKRYRAQSVELGEKKCVICGARGRLDRMHLTGNEADGEAANIAYGCRSCNATLGAAFKSIGAGKPTNQYNPAKGGIPTFDQYMWAVSNHSRGAHDAGGAIIHATPKHKRIEYAKRIVRKAQETKRQRFEDRWNPAAYRGMSVRKLESIRPHVAVRAVSDDWLERDRGRRELEAIDKALANARKRESRANAAPNAVTAKHEREIRQYIEDKACAGWSAEQVYRAIWRRWGYLGQAKDGAVHLKMSGGTEVFQVNPAKFDRCVEAVKAKRGAGNAYAVCTAAGARGKRRRNPASTSADVFEDFHGFAPSEVVTVTKEVHHHGHLAALGVLAFLEVWGIDGQGHTISGFAGALLCSNENRNQLFIEGGDQSIDLSDFGIRESHELETLGRVVKIAYDTDKTHLGDEGGRAVYVHKFRTTNDGGKHVEVPMAREPELLYDVRNQQLLLAGGSYEIKREGIDK